MYGKCGLPDLKIYRKMRIIKLMKYVMRGENRVYEEQ